MKKNRVVIVCGPTATGKSRLAFNIAQAIDGELVSADSRHIYRGMDIVTGKDISGWKHQTSEKIKKTVKGKTYDLVPYSKDGIRAWMMDCISPDEPFSVSLYKILAGHVMTSLWQRGKIPVVIGGTGFYIQSLRMADSSYFVPPDEIFRKNAQQMSVIDLSEKLQSLSQDAYDQLNVSDRKNPRRLIRRIEIVKHLGTIPQKTPRLDIDFFPIGLDGNNSFLYSRIDARVEDRLNNGALEEIEALLSAGYGNNIPSMSALGYRHFFPDKSRIKGSMEYQKAVEQWKYAEHAYARRQKTWFKKDPTITWFSIEDPTMDNKVESAMLGWYTSK